MGAWAEELAGAAVINLAGELVDRWATPANIELLRRSRVEPTTAIVAAAADVDEAPAVGLQASKLAIDGAEDSRTETIASEANPALLNEVGSVTA